MQGSKTNYKRHMQSDSVQKRENCQFSLFRIGIGGSLCLLPTVHCAKRYTLGLCALQCIPIAVYYRFLFGVVFRTRFLADFTVLVTSFLTASARLLT